MRKKIFKYLLITPLTAVVLVTTACSSFDKKVVQLNELNHKQLFQKKQSLDKGWQNLLKTINDSKSKFFFINEKIDLFWKVISRLEKDFLSASESSIVVDKDPSAEQKRNMTALKRKIYDKYFDEKKQDSFFSFTKKAFILSADVYSQLELHSTQLVRDSSYINSFVKLYNNVKQDKILSVEEKEDLRAKTVRMVGLAKDEIQRAILDPKLANLKPEDYDLLNRIVNPDAKHSFFHSHAMINILLELIMLINNSSNDKYVSEAKELEKELEANNLLSTSDAEVFGKMIKLIENKDVTPLWETLSKEANTFTERFNDIAHFVTTTL